MSGNTAPNIRARPTTYKGIRMRSRLEARYAAWLDRERIRWAYEPQCFADHRGQYLPDFVLRDVYILGRPSTVYVDVKPDFFTYRDTLDRMETIWASEPEAFLMVDAPVHPADDSPFVKLRPPRSWGGTLDDRMAEWCRWDNDHVALWWRFGIDHSISAGRWAF